MKLHRRVDTLIFASTFAILMAILNSSIAQAQDAAPTPQPTPTPTAEASQPKSKPWYEKIGFRGYTQIRYNRVGNPDPNLLSTQGDRSIGGTNNFFFRRARLVFSGDVSERVSVYIQPDLVVTPQGSTSGHFAQLRDLYADIYLDTAKEFRIRPGQSKIPYGFEDLQSSQNRIALDRNDGLNSAVRDERDLGLFFYWAPTEIRERFKELGNRRLKGSGDYGVVGLGIYNGQNANQPETNHNMHVVARLTYPFLLGNGQFIEAGVQAYTGEYTVSRADGSPIVLPANNSMTDRRVGVSFIYYPQPFGFQAEWNIGEGPELNDAKTEVIIRSLEGGYAQAMYRWGDLIPFVRTQYYRGGRKHEPFSPSQRVRETEVGFEWQADEALEFTGMYTWTDRTSSKAPWNNVADNLIRFQLQWNY